jgi:hypothetical protein
LCTLLKLRDVKIQSREGEVSGYPLCSIWEFELSVKTISVEL